MKKIKISVVLLFLSTLIISILISLTLFPKSAFEKPHFFCGTVANDYSYPQPIKPLDHPGQIIYKSNCVTCHTLDNELVGPPLRNIFEKRDSLWTVKMIKNAKKLRDSGDSMAIANFREYDSLIHTNFEYMPDSSLALLITYLIEEGKRD